MPNLLIFVTFNKGDLKVRQPTVIAAVGSLTLFIALSVTALGGLAAKVICRPGGNWHGHEGSTTLVVLLL